MPNGFLLLYIIGINIAEWILMGIDKRRAVKHQWRISEKTLWIGALIGGAAGGIAGMYTFRHKTRHFRFKLGMPVLFIIHLYLIVQWKG
ncbi:DUF1294 domain-containing protein [Sediminibacillus dalangtanensis]|uniref:DUF1294 domain-containing protein n=1 Tax=Sediminibacillus dalangtanensis TaxID=2729421 RepID=A0ABX7VZ89_9BACI|nr:DUF1294 domain-containing protein [Sediminibacillus dalangtanensis]QTN00032.1 DUF1294 domain-containing protein [Sediminibacillus dalangtanensis]